MYTFAKRTNWELKSNKLISAFEMKKKSGDKVFDLSESNPTRCGFRYPNEKILNALSDGKNLDYNPSTKGLLSAREAVCRYYKDKHVSVNPEQVFLTASTSEAYSFLFRLISNPGDRILFPQPSYPLFQYLTDLSDVEMGYYNLVYDESWRFDLESLKSGISPSTKAVVIVNPNNPTGTFISESETRAVNEACSSNHCAVICDEVFLDFNLSGRDCASLAGNTETLTFVMGGLSKCLGLPQMKLSWIVVSGPQGPASTGIEKLEIIADTYLSVNTPSQNALPSWFSLQPVIKDEIISRLKSNWAFLNQAFGKVADCRVLKQDGGWYAVLKLPGFQNEDEWVLDFLENEGVFAHPGYFFDFYDEPYIIISLLPQGSEFQEGVTRILNRVQASAKM